MNVRIIALIGAAALVAVTANAQSQQLSGGEILENGGGSQIKVLQCRQVPNYGWRECEIVAWKNNAPDSNPSWTDEGMLIKGDAAVRERMGLAARAAAAGQNRPAPGTRAAPAAAALTGQCPRTSYGGPIPGARPASIALLKQKIADSYTMQTRPPYWYGVTFERFAVGKAIRNSVGQLPGGGASRVNNGAPVGVVMYPVSSTYVVCEQSPGQAERRRIVNTHLCFVSKDNEWTCGGGGGPPPTITQLR